MSVPVRVYFKPFLSRLFELTVYMMQTGMSNGMSWSRATSLLSTASVVHSTIARTRLIKVALRRAAFALKSKLTSFTCSRSAVIIHAYIGQTQRPTVNTRLPWLTAIRTTCRQAAATICPRPSSPPWAPRRLPPPSRRQRSSSFPRPTRSHAHRCSPDAPTRR